MIEAVGLTKRYGDKTAVYNLSFQVRPGAVTGFLGPNGSGKSTTMRMILGLDNPTAGSVTIGGYPYRKLPNAPRQVGAPRVCPVLPTPRVGHITIRVASTPKRICSTITVAK